MAVTKDVESLKELVRLKTSKTEGWQNCCNGTISNNISLITHDHLFFGRHKENVLKSTPSVRTAFLNPTELWLLSNLSLGTQRYLPEFFR